MTFVVTQQESLAVTACDFREAGIAATKIANRATAG
jgi:hypothetical protein